MEDLLQRYMIRDSPTLWQKGSAWIAFGDLALKLARLLGVDSFLFDDVSVCVLECRKEVLWKAAAELNLVFLDFVYE